MLEERSGGDLVVVEDIEKIKASKRQQSSARLMLASCGNVDEFLEDVLGFILDCKLDESQRLMFTWEPLESRY